MKKIIQDYSNEQIRFINRIKTIGKNLFWFFVVILSIKIIHKLIFGY